MGSFMKHSAALGVGPSSTGEALTMQTWHWVWSLEPMSRKPKDEGSCLQPRVGRCRQQDSSGSHQPRLLGDLQANERSDFNKVRWRLGKEWHPRLVTFGLHTCTHQWVQTHIYSHCWQCQPSDVWCSSRLSSAKLPSALTVWLYLRPETHTTWLVLCLQDGAPCPLTSPSTEYSEGITTDSLLVNLLTIRCLCGVCALCGV